MRRDFALPEMDIDFLNSSQYKWETVRDGSMWVIIYDYPVPPGYNRSITNVALKIEAGYPVAQIDMVYFSPALQRNNGRPIRALANQRIQGNVWQRWSRHRTGQNPWRVGLDDISTHLQMVNHWMQWELTK